MSETLSLKIESLSPQDQLEVERFVEYLQYRAQAADLPLSDSEEAEIHQRLAGMRQSDHASVPAAIVFGELKAKYGR